MRIPLQTPDISRTRRKELLRFQKKAGLRFKRFDNLDIALCHRSFVHETSADISNNETLEFLGDSVIGMVVADYLIRLLPDRSEGDLARIKAHVVSEDTLADIALELGIDSVVRLGRGEESSGGRKKKALLCDCFEALVGSFFLDSGYYKAAKFVLKSISSPINLVLANRHRKDYKTLLQELVQKRFRSYPQYELDHKSGPDHRKIFWVNVKINGENYGPAKGANKKSAEQEAARIAYKKMVAEKIH